MTTGSLFDESIGIGRRQSPRIGEALQIALDLIELGDALGTANHHQPERPALPGARVFGQSRAGRRRLRERLQILAHLIRRRDLAARIVADHLAQRRDRRIVFRARPQRLVGLRAQRSHRDTERQTDQNENRKGADRKGACADRKRACPFSYV